MNRRTGDKYEDLKEEKINQALNRRKSNIMRIVFEKRKIQNTQEIPREKHKDQMEIKESESDRTLGHGNIINLHRTEEKNIRDKSFDINQNKNDFLIKGNMKNNAIDNRNINTCNIINNNQSGEKIGALFNNLYEKNINQRITLINKNPKTETINTEQTIKINPSQIDQTTITKEIKSNNFSKNIPQNQGYKGKSDSRENSQMKDNNKPLIEFENFNLKVFLSKIDLLKNTNNYKIKGPYIYCAVVRNLKFLNNANNQIIREMGANAAESLFPLNFYHAGIFE